MTCKPECIMTRAFDKDKHLIMISRGGKFPEGERHPMCADCLDSMISDVRADAEFESDCQAFGEINANKLRALKQDTERIKVKLKQQGFRV